MSKLLKKALCICLAMLTLMSMVPAQAASVKAKVYINTNIHKIYQKKSTSSTVLGTMAYGQKLTMLSYSGSWARVKNSSGKTGYCKITGLTNKSPNLNKMTVYAKKSSTPVYKKPRTSYGILTNVKKNTKLTAVAMTPDKKWLRVKNGDKYGYVLVSNVSKTKIKSGSSFKVYIIADDPVYITSGKGSGTKLGTASYGQSYTQVATSGSYAKIKNSSGKTGYILKSYLSTENPCDMKKTMYAQVSGKMLFASMRQNADTAKTLKKGAKVTAVAKTPDNTLYRVKYDGKYYYVPVALLNTKKASGSNLELMCIKQSKVYKKASTSSGYDSYIVEGDAVTLQGFSGKWAKINVIGGGSGYVPISRLIIPSYDFGIG